MFVDLETAKRDLRIEGAASDADIVDKITQAGEILADYLKRDLSEYDINGSAAEPVPGPLKAATLLAIRALYDGGDPLGPTVKNLLWRWRDPAMS